MHGESAISKSAISRSSAVRSQTVLPFTADRSQHEQLTATVSQLEANNVGLTDENRHLAEAASERETFVQELQEETRSLHTR